MITSLKGNNIKIGTFHPETAHHQFSIPLQVVSSQTTIKSASTSCGCMSQNGGNVMGLYQVGDIVNLTFSIKIPNSIGEYSKSIRVSWEDDTNKGIERIDISFDVSR